MWNKETIILILKKINRGELDINEVIKEMNVETKERLDFYEECYKVIYKST